MKIDTKRKKSKKQPSFKINITIEKFFPKTSRMSTSSPSLWDLDRLRPSPQLNYKGQREKA